MLHHLSALISCDISADNDDVKAHWYSSLLGMEVAYRSICSSSASDAAFFSAELHSLGCLRGKRHGNSAFRFKVLQIVIVHQYNVLPLLNDDWLRCPDVHGHAVHGPVANSILRPCHSMLQGSRDAKRPVLLTHLDQIQMVSTCSVRYLHPALHEPWPFIHHWTYCWLFICFRIP